VRSRPHHGCLTGRQRRLGTNHVVIPHVSHVCHRAMTVVMSGPFTALMVEKKSDVIDLTAVSDGGTEDAVGTVQLCDQKTSVPSQYEFRPFEQRFPTHRFPQLNPSCDNPRPERSSQSASR